MPEKWQIYSATYLSKCPRLRDLLACFRLKNCEKTEKLWKKRILIVFWDHKNDDFVEKKDDLPEYFLTNEEQQNPKKSDLSGVF